MTAKTVVNLPASVRARLLSIAQAQQIDFQILLNRYIIERLLYRLGQSPERANFTLKGAMLFTLWVPAPYRMTRDLDLLGSGSDNVAAMVKRMAAICRTPVLDDGVRFDADAIEGEQIRAEDEYVGVRLHVPASIGNARTRIQVDIGLGDAAPGIRDATYPVYLDFPAPNVRVYSREAAIAEKFEAIASLGVTNSRMKDFFDISALARNFAFEGPTLADAIAQTFTRRGRPFPATPPIGLTTEWAGTRMQETRWRAFLKRAAIPGPHPSFADVVDSIQDFLMPVGRALAAAQSFEDHWQPGGPWQPNG